MEKISRIVVTGGSGMVGRLLVERLQRDGFTSVLAPSSKRLDLRDQHATDRFFAEHPADYLFHLAGHIGGIGASVSHPVEFLYENMMIGLNLIHAARIAVRQQHGRGMIQFMRSVNARDSGAFVNIGLGQ